MLLHGHTKMISVGKKIVYMTNLKNNFLILVFVSWKRVCCGKRDGKVTPPNLTWCPTFNGAWGLWCL